MVETTDKNPFLHLNARSSFLCVVAGLIPLAVWRQSEVLLNYAVYGLMLLWMGWQFRRLGISTPRMVGTLARDSVWIPMIAVMVPVVVLFSASCWVLLITLLWMVSPGAAQTVQGMVDSTDRSLTWTLAVLVAPPIEELFFRGVLLHRWSARWGLRRAVLLSSLVFALLHANFLGLFAFGCAMAVLYIRSGSLLLPIICHALNNLIATALLDTSFGQGWPFSRLVLTAAGSVLVSGACLLFFLWKNWPSADCRTPYFANSDGLSHNDREAGHVPEAAETAELTGEAAEEPVLGAQ